MSTDVIPVVVIHDVATGGQIDGTATNGTDSEETLFRGRIRKFTSGTKGGLFTAPAQIGMRVRNVMWNLPAGATPTVTISLVDGDGFAYVLNTMAAVSSAVEFRNEGVLVPPGWKLKVASTHVCTAQGRVLVLLDRGWSVGPFDVMATLGKETLP